MIQFRQQYISHETVLLAFKTSKFWNNFALFLKIFCTLPKEGCLLNTPTLLEILVKLHTFPYKNIGIYLPPSNLISKYTPPWGG